MIRRAVSTLFQLARNHVSDKSKLPLPFPDYTLQAPVTNWALRLSYHVMRMALCKLLYRFDLELAPESENWLDGQLTFGTRSKPPLMAYVKKASA
jgi:hypothetical protein